MAPYNRNLGFPNPFPRRAEAAPYAGAQGPPPDSNLDPKSFRTAYYPSHIPYPQPQPTGPPRTAPSGRLANRYNGITTHQDAFTQAPAQSSSGAVPGGATPYPFPPSAQNMHPQANPYSQHPGPHIPPAQNFTHTPPPTTSTQRMGGAPQSIPGPAPQFPSLSSLQDALPPHTPPPSTAPSGPSSRPSYLIIGLFALRLTRQLILRLDPYPSRDLDLHWLDAFLTPYPSIYALAKLTDPRTIEAYVQAYPRIVRTMIKQPRYRRVFMDMNPDKGTDRKGMGTATAGEMTEGEYIQYKSRKGSGVRRGETNAR
ncbi:uncharacterized protein N0V89_006765 [Didymosphaeria variabile]|uniref:Uncharacterized protein n=1 Tax=Didymosphaeria variabile TaxID=1932322 RepID=A0A9W8XJS1_9PLEO|nr:uncharacterized protein N0V89_006765 [Didymosphaeria variabile]KAJ4351423.1 hypothetical protein N0V89_006765 [Didymosphaeria variabile]